MISLLFIIPFKLYSKNKDDIITIENTTKSDLSLEIRYRDLNNKSDSTKNITVKKGSSGQTSNFGIVIKNIKIQN